MPEKVAETVVVRANEIRLVKRRGTDAWQAHYKVAKLSVWLRKSTKTNSLTESPRIY
jgi:hypothetical protein